jgi:hypothetical protein
MCVFTNSTIFCSLFYRLRTQFEANSRTLREYRFVNEKDNSDICHKPGNVVSDPVIIFR